VDPVNTYTIYQIEGTIETIVDDPSNLGKDFIIDVSNYYENVRIAGVNIGGGNKIEFNPLGTPYDDKEGSAITLTGSITLEYSGMNKLIQITPNTGRIIIP
jgi:hypothetical protein